MKLHETISGKKVQSIMNRRLDYSKPYEVSKANIEDLWDEGMITRNVYAEIRPVSGSGRLQVLGHSSKQAWLEKVVKINGSWYRLADIGKALGQML